MDNIKEFLPIELIISFDINDLPEQFIKLINNYNKKYILGTEIQVLTWEWCYNKEYYLIIDITLNNEGCIYLNNDMIYTIKNNNLTLVNNVGKQSILHRR